MKVLAFFVWALSLCAFGFAAESVGLFNDPAHPGKCVYKHLILNPGEEAKLPESCGRIICGNDSFATIQTCGLTEPPPGCRFTDFININAPYSECCNRKVVC